MDFTQTVRIPCNPLQSHNLKPDPDCEYYPRTRARLFRVYRPLGVINPLLGCFQCADDADRFLSDRQV